MGGLEHGWIGAQILLPVLEFVKRGNLGIVVFDVLFRFERNPDQALVPDMAFVRADRLPPRDAWHRVAEMPPDLVLEVVSPNDTGPEIAEKVAYYLAHGVPLVWVAYPSRREIVVHRPGQGPRPLGIGDVLDGEEILPSFRLPLADVFA
jgi:Uma2 family endonuclease